MAPLLFVLVTQKTGNQAALAILPSFGNWIGLDSSLVERGKRSIEQASLVSMMRGRFEEITNRMPPLQRSSSSVQPSMISDAFDCFRISRQTSVVECWGTGNEEVFFLSFVPTNLNQLLIEIWELDSRFFDLNYLFARNTSSLLLAIPFQFIVTCVKVLEELQRAAATFPPICLNGGDERRGEEKWRGLGENERESCLKTWGNEGSMSEASLEANILEEANSALISKTNYSLLNLAQARPSWLITSVVFFPRSLPELQLRLISQFPSSWLITTGTTGSWSRWRFPFYLAPILLKPSFPLADLSRLGSRRAQRSR